MRKLFQLLCMCVVLCFVACSSDDSAKDSKDSTPTLRVGLSAEYPPFEYKKDGKIVGFDIDLLDAISKKAGFKYTLNHMSFDGLIPALKAGKIDMIMSGMSATSERMKQVDFSVPYYEGQTLFIKRKDSKDIVDKDSIKGKRIGVFLGTVQEQAAQKMKQDYQIEVVMSDSILGAILNLKSSKVDIVLADYATAQGYLKEYPDDLEGFYQESDGSEGLSIAFDKGKHADLLAKINTAIKELKESGEYDKIMIKNNLKSESKTDMATAPKDKQDSK